VIAEIREKFGDKKFGDGRRKFGGRRDVPKLRKHSVCPQFAQFANLLLCGHRHHANPMEDIESLRKINFVIKDGKIVRRP
jgi:hypothetical protein